MANVLVCDDERSIRELLDIALRKEGHKVEIVNSGELAVKKIESARYDVIVTDIKMPGMNGIDVLRHAHRVSPQSAVVLITAVGDFDSAVHAVKSGAFDYIQKTPNGLVDEIRVSIGRASEVLNDGRCARPCDAVHGRGGVTQYRTRGSDAKAKGMARRQRQEPG